MDLEGMRIAENRRKLKMTVLHRPDGAWHRSEIAKLVKGLFTEASEHPQHPEYLVLYGHYTKEKTLAALGGGVAYTATQVTGIPNDKLPYAPGFI